MQVFPGGIDVKGSYNGTFTYNKARLVATTLVSLPFASGSIDGVVVVTNDQVLLTANGVSNGLYTYSGTSLSRTVGFESAQNITHAFISVSSGVTNAGTLWMVTSSANVVGLDSIVYSKIAGSFTAFSDNSLTNGRLLTTNGNNTISSTNLSSTNDSLIINGVSITALGTSGTISVPNVTSDVFTLNDASQTLLNKTIDGNLNTVFRAKTNAIMTSFNTFQNINVVVPTSGQYMVSNGTVITWRNGVNAKGDLQTFTTQNDRLQVGFDTNLLLADSTTATGLKWDTMYTALPRVVYVEIQPLGTHGGTFTSGAWNTRVINFEIGLSNITGASFTSNVITLPAGRYHFDITAPAYRVNSHRIRLYNDTILSPISHGTTEYCSTATSRSRILETLLLSTPTDLRIEHRCGTTRATNGYGIASGLFDEIYTVVEIIKLS